MRHIFSGIQSSGVGGSGRIPCISDKALSGIQGLVFTGVRGLTVISGKILLLIDWKFVIIGPIPEFYKINFCCTQHARQHVRVYTRRLCYFIVLMLL